MTMRAMQKHHGARRVQSARALSVNSGDVFITTQEGSG